MIYKRCRRVNLFAFVLFFIFLRSVSFVKLDDIVSTYNLWGINHRLFDTEDVQLILDLLISLRSELLHFFEFLGRFFTSFLGIVDWFLLLWRHGIIFLFEFLFTFLSICFNLCCVSRAISSSTSADTINTAILGFLSIGVALISDSSSSDFLGWCASNEESNCCSDFHRFF